jgi:protein-S-isoprenylcysteine O-methyltransferase Ste14
MRILHTVGWIACIIYSTIPSYWLLVHPPIDYWRARRARLLRVGPLWLLLWLLAGALTWPWRRLTLYDSWWGWIPGVLLIAISVGLYAAARRDFSTDQVLGRSELEPHKHEQRLHTHGIRNRVRHPYYLAHFCELLGWTLGTGLVVLYALLVFAVVTGVTMIRAEERELQARFGEAYRAYQRRVPVFFPRL